MSCNIISYCLVLCCAALHCVALRCAAWYHNVHIMTLIDRLRQLLHIWKWIQSTGQQIHGWTISFAWMHESMQTQNHVFHGAVDRNGSSNNNGKQLIEVLNVSHQFYTSRWFCDLARLSSEFVFFTNCSSFPSLLFLTPRLWVTAPFHFPCCVNIYRQMYILTTNIVSFIISIILYTCISDRPFEHRWTEEGEPWHEAKLRSTGRLSPLQLLPRFV